MDVNEPLTSYGVALQPSAPPKLLLFRPRAMQMFYLNAYYTVLQRKW